MTTSNQQSSQTPYSPDAQAGPRGAQTATGPTASLTSAVRSATSLPRLWPHIPMGADRASGSEGIAATREMDGDELIWTIVPVKRVTRMRRIGE